MSYTFGISQPNSDEELRLRDALSLLRRASVKLKKGDSGSVKLAAAINDWMQRYGLQGSPLRQE